MLESRATETVHRPDRQIIRFDLFEADLAARELRKRGVRLKLQDQPFQVLAALLETPGEVVNREELQDRIWGDDTFVDFDKSLSAAVNKIRQALDDSRTRPRFIETIPKVGYRFIGSLDAETPPSDAAPAADRRVVFTAYAAVGVLLAGLLVLAGWVWSGATDDSPTAIAISPPVPLTSYPGDERQPTFSPDGRQVAFARRQEPARDFDIWVKVIGTEDSLQLTSDGADEMSPAWSPDGREIAFLRHQAGGSADVVLISPHGGTERKLTEMEIHTNPMELVSLDWSADGDSLLTYESSWRGNSGALVSIAVASGEKRRVLEMTGTSLDYSQPAVSHDGGMVAFLMGNPFEPELAVVGVDWGEPRILADAVGRAWGGGLAWTPDGSGIVAGNPLSIFPLSGEPPVPLPGVSGRAKGPAVSAAAHLLAFRVSAGPYSNWLLDVRPPRESPKAFAPSTKSASNPQFSADGRSVVFSSSRSGKLAVWAANLDGTNLHRLTDMTIGGSPRWSPDGSEVAFDAPHEGAYEIYAVPSFGGTPRRVTTSPMDDVAPSYSRDGRWIYFSSNRSGEFQVWKVQTEGEAKKPNSAQQVTQGGGFGAFESLDGRFVYYAKANSQDLSRPTSLWRIPVGGGREEEVIDELYSNWCNWALSGDQVFFLNPADDRLDDPSWAIYSMDLTSRVVSLVAPVAGQPHLGGPGFDVSHDGRWILYTARDSSESDLMLVEGLR